MEIKYYNREKAKVEAEKIYGGFGVNLLYKSKIGIILNKILALPIFSKLYGIYQNSYLSKFKIKPFIKKFSINIDEYMPENGRNEKDPYSNFNSFFTRRFKSEKRIFEMSKNIMPAPCEARYYGFEEVNEQLSIPIKGEYLKASYLLNSNEYGHFKSGPLIIARLCPTDYHRFHFPDDGKIILNYKVPGKLNSVNPMAVNKYPNIFITNERHISIINTENFGKLAYIEVGAICVGKIIQTHKLKEFKRGNEKGYFLFGASSVLIAGEKGAWKPSLDILENTKNKMETFVLLGKEIAKA